MFGISIIDITSSLVMWALMSKFCFTYKDLSNATENNENEYTYHENKL